MFNEVFSFSERQSPFQVTSKYVVGTGTTISGKTSVLDALKIRYERQSFTSYQLNQNLDPALDLI
jgi:hypothetical protein